MKTLDDDGNIKNLQIGPHKYSKKGESWECTSACYGSIKVVGDRYAEMNLHKCDAEVKQRKIDEATERRENQV
jgi:hypothetical protein